MSSSPICYLNYIENLTSCQHSIIRISVLYYGHKNERFYHSGVSSKDAAVRLTTAITELTSADMKKHLHTMIDQMLNNPPLNLK